MKRLVPILMFALASWSLADVIQVNYSAVITSTSGSPFGPGVTNGLPVNGFFIYDTATPDSNGTLNRGDYMHVANGGFEANFGSNTVTGSSTPFIRVEDFLPGISDTWRFLDGQGQGGVMSVDGVPDPLLGLNLTISDPTGTAFTDDSQPNPFAFLDGTGPFDWPNTFVLSGDAGSLTMQLRTTTQAVPEPSTAMFLFAAMGVFWLRRKMRGA